MDIQQWEGMTRADQVKWLDKQASWQDMFDLLSLYAAVDAQDVDPELVFDWIIEGLRGLRRMSNADLREQLEGYMNEPEADAPEPDGEEFRGSEYEGYMSERQSEARRLK